MQLNLAIGLSRIIRISISILGLGVSTIFAGTNVTIGLNGKSFGHGQSLHLESSGLLDASKAYTYTMQGTLKATGNLAFLNGKTLAQLADLVEPGGSSKLSKVKDNPTGSLPLTQLSNHTYAGTVSTLSISFTVSSMITSAGKVILDIKNISITSAAVPVPGKITFGDSSKLLVTIAPELRFHQLVQNISENAGQVDVTVERWGYLGGPTSVGFSTADGTARNGVDYSEKHGSLDFAAGENKKIIQVNIINNSVKDGTRKFTMTLSSPAKGSALGINTKTTIGIANDD